MTLEHVIDFDNIIQQFTKKNESKSVVLNHINEVLKEDPKHETNEDIIACMEKYGVDRKILKEMLKLYEKSNIMAIDHINHKVCECKDIVTKMTCIAKAPHIQPILKLNHIIAEMVNYNAYKFRVPLRTIYASCVNAVTELNMFKLDLKASQYHAQFNESLKNFYDKNITDDFKKKITGIILPQVESLLKKSTSTKKPKLGGGVLSKPMSATDNIEDLQHKIKIISVILFCVLLIVVIAVISVIVYNLTSKKSYAITFV